MMQSVGKMLRSKALNALVVLAVLVGVFGGTLTASGQSNTANYVSLDFVASAPLSYNHAVGGGAFDDRTVGRSADIVESLEGGDFICGDVASFLLQISLDGTQPNPNTPRTARFLFDFTLDTTGQSGLALGPVTYVGVNYGAVSGGDGPGGVDSGMIDDTGSVATLVSQTAPTQIDPPYFTPGEVNRVTIDVTDLEGTETVIVRIDAEIACKFGLSPTGNLQASINDADIIAPVAQSANIPVGQQTVPFKAAEDVVFPGEIIVDKVTIPTGSSDAFNFKVSAPGSSLSPAYMQTFSLTDAAIPWNSGFVNPSFANIGKINTLIAGTYTVTEEALPAGWDLDGIVCTNADGVVQGTRSGSSLAFNLDENEIVTCVFTNRQTTKDLTVTKTAYPSFTRTWDWTITKEADAIYNLFAGQAITHGYTVTVNPTEIDSAWKVSGTITVTNHNYFAVSGVNVTDTVSNGGTCTVDMATVNIPANSSVGFGYICTWGSQPSSNTGTNTATATWTKDANFTSAGSASGVKEFTFDNPTKINSLINVDDDKLTGESWSTNGVAASWSYTKTFTCSSNPADYASGKSVQSLTNTATIIETTDDSDSATVTVNCFAPIVSKTAAGTYDERHEWTVEKSVSPETQNAFAGDTVNYEWKIVVGEQTNEENFKVAGAITVQNPSPMTMVVEVADLLGGGTAAAITAGTACDYTAGTLTIAPGATATCDYVATPGNRTDTVNKVDATLNNIKFSASKEFGWTSNVIRGSATVTDAQIGLNQTITEGGTFTKAGQYACSSVAGSYSNGGSYSFSDDNTAIVTSDGAEEGRDSATVSVTCWKTPVIKTAVTKYSRIFDYDIQKSVDLPNLTLHFTETATVNYQLQVTKFISEENGYGVDGTIVISNPAPIAANLAEVTDVLPGAANMQVTCPQPLVVPPLGELTCTYGAGLPNSALRTNTAVATLANGMSFSGTAPVDFTNANVTLVNDSIQISDTFFAEPWTVFTSTKTIYAKTFDCRDAATRDLDGFYRVQYPNVAQALLRNGAAGSVTVNIACYQYASIGDRVWVDVNPNALASPGKAQGNGQQDYTSGNVPVEKNVAGVWVLLFKPDGTLVQKVQTNTSGTYLFANVIPGEYFVVFANPGVFNGVWTSFNPAVGDAIDSNADPSLPITPELKALVNTTIGSTNADMARTPVFTVAPDQQYIELDAGLIDLSGLSSVDLSGLVWLDSNRDGIRQENETVRVPGITVGLYKTDPANPSQVDKVNDTLTGADGTYSFVGLDAGTYFVKFLTPGYTVSPMDAQGKAQDGLDSDIDPVTGQSQPVTVTIVTVMIDAGLYTTPTNLPPSWEPTTGGSTLFLPLVQS